MPNSHEFNVAYSDLRSVLPGDSLCKYQLRDCSEIALYLLDDGFDDRSINQEQSDRLGNAPPYWIFVGQVGTPLLQRFYASS